MTVSRRRGAWTDDRLAIPNNRSESLTARDELSERLPPYIGAARTTSLEKQAEKHGPALWNRDPDRWWGFQKTACGLHQNHVRYRFPSRLSFYAAATSSHAGRVCRCHATGPNLDYAPA